MGKFKITPQQQIDFINEIAPLAQAAYKTLGKVLPSVCIGMACVESGFGWGTDGTRLMYKHNAILGYKVGSGKTATKYWSGKAYKATTKEEYQVGVHTVVPAEAFREYDSLAQCILNYYELLNTSLYKRVTANVDYATQMHQIKACGYMTSSTEVNSVLKIINQFNLTQFDNGVYTSIPKENPKPIYKENTTYTTKVNLYVRDSTYGNKIKFDALTQDGKAHGHFDDYGYAILEKNTRVTCFEVDYLDNSTWMRIPSGWVCAIEEGKIYIE